MVKANSFVPLGFLRSLAAPLAHGKAKPLAFTALGSLVLAQFVLAGCSSLQPLPPRGSLAGLPPAVAVKVTTCREGNVTKFLVRNDEWCEVTMTFELALRNLKGEVAFPYTATFPPRQVTEAFSLSPESPDKTWEYSYTNYYKLGSQCARHDDSFVYWLPYAAGRKFHVTQGYNGRFSHKGSNLYAIDWDMPEGTAVYAARGGVVVKVKDDSDMGGSSIAYDRFNNYVLVRHDDGTLGHYCHLKKGGCRVKPGQVVVAGDLLAYSGNTGFSSGPHLHFAVFKTKDGRERESIPVKFRTAEGNALTLLSGRTYKATAWSSHSEHTVSGNESHASKSQS